MCGPITALRQGKMLCHPTEGQASRNDDELSGREKGPFLSRRGWLSGALQLDGQHSDWDYAAG